MNKPHNWNLLERLSDLSTPLEERQTLELELNQDPGLKDTLQTFRILQSWPESEGFSRDHTDPATVLQRLEEEWQIEALDKEMGRQFQWLAAASLAAAIILGLLNITAMEDSTSGTLDALFGLPQQTIDNLFLAEQ